VKLYTIKPLKWERFNSPCYKQWTTKAMDGNYYVECKRNAQTGKWGEFTMSFCFQEYYDEGRVACDSMGHGAALAEKDWQQRIMVALEPVKKASK